MPDSNRFSESSRTMYGETPSQPNPTSSKKLSSVSTSLRETIRPGISKRSDFPLNRQKSHLLIIDVQQYLSETDEEGFFLESVQRMRSNIPALIQTFRSCRDTQEKGCEVIFTYLQALTNDGRDISTDYKLSGPELANIPRSNTPLKDLFLESVMPEFHGKGDILIPKTSCNVFASTNIDYVLRNLHVEQLVICGQLTDQCVESAVRDAADLGYLVTVVQDACAAKSADAETKGFHGMAGFCRFLSTQQVIQELNAGNGLASLLPSLVHAKDRGAMRLRDGLYSRSTATGIEPSFFTPKQQRDYTLALIRSLKAAGVEFLRYLLVDVCNTIRCKAVPLDHLLKEGCLNYQLCFATVVVSGLPPYGDKVTKGTGLDASGVMILQPDLSTLRILPYATKSAVVLGTVHDPKRGGTLSELCTRGLLQKVVKAARKNHGIELCVGAEIEFCLHIAERPPDNSVFCNTTTLNQQEQFITDLYKQLRDQRIPIEAIHAESAPGQLEVVIGYQRDPVALADFVVLAQETIRSVGRSRGLKALFLPKLDPLQAGNGLHLHLSFNDISTGENAFSSPTGMSERGKSFVQGILDHMSGLLALTLPTHNSFRRMGPGCWTGFGADWAVEDKEASLRICSSLVDSNRWQHVEYKLNDSTGNLYLNLSAILMCAVDGIGRDIKLQPSKSDAVETDLGTSFLPNSIEECLEALEQDELLMGLMGPALSKAYLALRRAEAKRASKMSLEEEVQEALSRT